ncbi:hypothetical protein ANN_26037 [Periplaneta americana]|uniref:HTH psq-type domain-containing protein n=1 Tax=Periplaneta americana TaxID=6978 RepID=A0ABQ8S4V0_PERAM|nr:hypothetical protein ANN_26037 [Periplaneta americana]
MQWEGIDAENEMQPMEWNPTTNPAEHLATSGYQTMEWDTQWKWEKYKKEASGRDRWSEESLAQAMVAVRGKKMGVNEASRDYGIPSRTLRRRIIKNSTKKLGLGPYEILGYENELRLVRHIKRLEESGFALTSKDLQQVIFKSLKAFYNQVSDNNYLFTTNKGRKITRLWFGTLLGKAWEGAATNANACKGFKACGIHPFDENAIPDVAFSVIAGTMPRTYKRKPGVPAQGQWEVENLREAVTCITKGEMASRYYSIPESTIRRRKASNSLIKTALGPEGVFGREIDKRLAKHIKHLASSGFVPD